MDVDVDVFFKKIPKFIEFHQALFIQHVCEIVAFGFCEDQVGPTLALCFLPIQ